MHLCVCYVAPRSSTVNADSCPYDALQLDIAEAQSAGGCIVVCGDMNARTAELDDYIRLADLQDYVDVLDEGAYLNSCDIPSRSNCDKPPGNGTWGCELLDLCRSTDLLIANGRTLGDVRGEYTFTSPRGQSTVDYFVVSAEHLSSVADMKCCMMHSIATCHVMCHMTDRNQITSLCSLTWRVPSALTTPMQADCQHCPQFKYVESHLVTSKCISAMSDSRVAYASCTFVIWYN